MSLRFYSQAGSTAVLEKWEVNRFPQLGTRGLWSTASLLRGKATLVQKRRPGRRRPLTPHAKVLLSFTQTTLGTGSCIGFKKGHQWFLRTWRIACQDGVGPSSAALCHSRPSHSQLCIPHENEIQDDWPGRSTLGTCRTSASNSESWHTLSPFRTPHCMKSCESTSALLLNQE